MYTTLGKLIYNKVKVDTTIITRVGQGKNEEVKEQNKTRDLK